MRSFLFGYFIQKKASDISTEQFFVDYPLYALINTSFHLTESTLSRVHWVQPLSLFIKTIMLFNIVVVDSFFFFWRYRFFKIAFIHKIYQLGVNLKNSLFDSFYPYLYARFFYLGEIRKFSFGRVFFHLKRLFRLAIFYRSIFVLKHKIKKTTMLCHILSIRGRVAGVGVLLPFYNRLLIALHKNNRYLYLRSFK